MGFAGLENIVLVGQSNERDTTGNWPVGQVTEVGVVGKSIEVAAGRIVGAYGVDCFKSW